MQIGVVGLGSAGLPLACAIADKGLNVVGIDLNSKRVEDINNKINPIPSEKEVDAILEKSVGKNFKAVKNIIDAKADVYIVIVPLFIDEDKKPNFMHLKSAFEDIAKVLKKNDTVVLETTVPPNTTNTFVKEILESSGLKAGTDFYLGYSPERIMTGHSVSRYQKFPKIISSTTKEGLEKLKEIYSGFCENVIEASNTQTAELIKISEGVYRDVNISIANELFKVSEELGINYYEVREKASHKFCNLLEPSVGVGGHCIPVYPWFLINNFEVPMIKKAREINDDMANYFANKAERKKSALIIGLAFREGVKESNYSGAKLLIKALQNKGIKVSGLDPNFDEEETKELFGIEKSEDFKNHEIIYLANKLPEYLNKLEDHKDKVIDVKGLMLNNRLQEDYS